MRSSLPKPLKKKGRYVLLGAALLAAGAGWLARSGGHASLGHGSPGHWGQSAAPANLAQGDEQPGVQPSSPLPGGPCLQAPPGSEAPAPPARLSGRLGLYVAVIDPGTLQPLRVVSHDPGGVFPLASTYKQAVLWALLGQIDAGRVQLSETFDVSPASQSLGDYPFDHSGVMELAARMIHNSDNTATDLLHRRLGLQAVQDVADHLKLCQTRLILPTKAWWSAQAGLSPGFPGASRFAALRGPPLLQAALALDTDAQRSRPDRLQQKLDDYFDHRYSPATDLGTQNVSTPAELAHLVAAEFLHSGLSEGSQRLQREVMASGYGRSRMNVPVSYFGGKGGNGWRMLTYSGYLHTQGGEDVVYAFMQHGADEQYTMPNTGAAFKWVNAAMKQVLLESDGGMVKATNAAQVNTAAESGLTAKPPTSPP